MVSNTVWPWWMALVYLALLAAVILLFRFLTARRNARYQAEQKRLQDAIDETNHRDRQ
jgi:preprotein translocase subunit YajC